MTARLLKSCTRSAPSSAPVCPCWAEPLGRATSSHQLAAAERAAAPPQPSLLAQVAAWAKHKPDMAELEEAAEEAVPLPALPGWTDLLAGATAAKAWVARAQLSADGPPVRSPLHLQCSPLLGMPVEKSSHSMTLCCSQCCCTADGIGMMTSAARAFLALSAHEPCPLAGHRG